MKLTDSIILSEYLISNELKIYLYDLDHYSQLTIQTILNIWISHSLHNSYVVCKYSNSFEGLGLVRTLGRR